VVKDGPFILDAMLIQELSKLFMRKVRKGQQVFFIAMPVNNFHQVINGTGTKKDLALAVNNVFLEVEGNRFRYAEIFHGIGDNDPELAAYAEKMVNGCFAVEYYGRMRENINALFSEIFTGDTLNMTERSKINFNIIFFR
jgi:hypothetical protein